MPPVNVEKRAGSTRIPAVEAARRLQPIVDRDETSFRRRNGASDALTRLRSASEALVYRVQGDRVDLLLGRRLGGLQLAAPRDAAAVQEFVNRFYRDYQGLFSVAALDEGSVRVERVRSASTTVAEVRQHSDGVPIRDARWTLIFDAGRYLTHVMGAPFDPERITVGRRATIDGEQAAALALEHESLTRDDAEVSAELAIEGQTNRLVWAVELSGRRNPGLSCEIRIDAHHRTVIARRDRCEHAVLSIPVRHYSHPGGVKDSTGSTTTSNIVVDAIEMTVPPKVPNAPPGTVYSYSLQRIGSGRSRIWNAKPEGVNPIPTFSRTMSNVANYFTQLPGATPNWIFNEQQTYYWAQTLKTAIDEWGREPNEYGHYPVDSTRAVNVEIVVNGDALMEGVWKLGMNVQHGYFRRDTPGDWFSNPAETVPAVFLFNSAGNSTSPQFFGPEYSGSYSIIAHEVGHFISWQYGSWQGASDRLAASLSEGHSMVLAALLGKRCFGAALAYDESTAVTTGGQPQWSHTPALKYSDMDCINDDQYDIAHPFVQAMWRLMNNKDANGDAVWGSAGAAISNTADLFMYSLYNFTDDSTMTWDKLCLALLARLYGRIEDGLEKEPLMDSWCAVRDVFAKHGLLQPCRNSPETLVVAGTP
jgi:hypothetical protein